MTALPLSVVAGYLGAGKTTLINRILAEDHGLRLMVIVNDFGAINIYADLLESADEDTIALTNGCVCCTMGPDLQKALDRALDRHPRPDHLIVEASGIADPVAIANAAIAEPELGYAGIITVVDGLNLPELLQDSLIAPQVRQQISCADLVWVTKCNEIPAALDQMDARGARLADATELGPLLFDVAPLPVERSENPHPDYTRWLHESDEPLDRAMLGEKLENRPKGLYRLKGFILTDDGGYEVHIVGQYVSARRAKTDRTRLVALGPADRLAIADIDAWWHSPS